MWIMHTAGTAKDRCGPGTLVAQREPHRDAHRTHSEGMVVAGLAEEDWMSGDGRLERYSGQAGALQE